MQQVLEDAGPATAAAAAAALTRPLFSLQEDLRVPPTPQVQQQQALETMQTCSCSLGSFGGCLTEQPARVLPPAVCGYTPLPSHTATSQDLGGRKWSDLFAPASELKKKLRLLHGVLKKLTEGDILALCSVSKQVRHV